jgi:hypothetical protein
MTSRLLDVSAMPFERVYACNDGSQINMSEFVDSHYDAIQALAAAGLIKSNESFGFAMLEPMTQEMSETLPGDYWDKPEDYVWFVGGWGPDRDRYIANAVRKLRPLLRMLLDDDETFFAPSTLEMRLEGRTDLFTDIVGSTDENGLFPWGDFPWGGAFIDVVTEEFALIGSISALSQIEDDFCTKLFLGGVKQRIIVGNKMLADD